MQWKLIILVMISFTSAPHVMLSNAYAEERPRQFDKTGTQWTPLEWSFENPTFNGNPYDLIATVTFVHSKSGEKRRTELFYDGESTWKFRFTGTCPGEWTFTTSSKDEDLDGKHGAVVIRHNPGVNGFVTNFGNKWGWTGTNRAFVPQLVMYASPKHIHGNAGKIDGDINRFFVEHGFNGFHVMGSCHWFDIDKKSSSEIDSPDANPDRRTFEALELLITKVHKAGGMVHIWAWGDDSRKWTPTRWGKNGTVDRRLQRYIAARLGPLPGWTMGYGFDNWEWASEDDLRRWHAYLHEHFGWPHLLGARAHNNRLTQIYEGLDYSGYEQHRPDYETYIETIEKRPNKPSFSEDRFRIRQRSRYAHKDYDIEMTRRGLWHSTMAGGVANIWGCLNGQESELGSKPYPHPEQFKTYSEFFSSRFLKDMVCDNSVTDGVCLRDSRRMHYIFYKENTVSIEMDLSAMSEAQKAIAVDTEKAYSEILIGRFTPKKHTWNAKYRSDWIIAVGAFASSDTQQNG
ncbi:MAG: DUF5060 domain-containing protein [Planctomycetota bacterium]|jgi:hypothetical protein